MQIGQIIKHKQYDIWVKLEAFIQSKPRNLKTSHKLIDKLMREKPGFYKDEKLPR